MLNKCRSRGCIFLCLANRVFPLKGNCDHFQYRVALGKYSSDLTNYHVGLSPQTMLTVSGLLVHGDGKERVNTWTN
jgi:hypothetical protein